MYLLDRIYPQSYGGAREGSRGKPPGEGEVVRVMAPDGDADIAAQGGEADIVGHGEADIAFDSSLVEMDLRANSAAEVIARLAARLTGKGYVTPEFAEAVVKREQEFATGLPTAVPVAIPHTSARYCVRSALAVGLLKEPVDFGEMGNPQQVLPVRIVFLLAIADPDAQVLWLQRFMRGLRDAALLSRLAGARHPGEVVELVTAMLGQGEGWGEKGSPEGTDSEGRALPDAARGTA